MEVDRILQGDALKQLKTLPDESVNCVVTSPPYYGLRDYGTDNQLGLEDTPQEYVKRLVEIFREIKRVLRHDGTVWLNLGDSYAGNGVVLPGNHTGLSKASEMRDGIKRNPNNWSRMNGNVNPVTKSSNLKPKNLIGIPWRVAFALQDDGWYLRSDIIWSKPNPMPESVTDRPTKSHEYIFLLAKSARYYFDQEAVRESYNTKPDNGWLGNSGKTYNSNNEVKNTNGTGKTTLATINSSGRNIRTVWNIATKPYSGAHFAVFPPKLIEPCIKAGCSARVCVECETPWVRVVEKEKGDTESFSRPKAMGQAGYGSTSSTLSLSGNGSAEWAKRGAKKITLGFSPRCQCNAGHKPGVVLDPFMGSGTVASVAIAHKRNWLGIELNPDYIKLAEERIRKTQPALFAL